MTFPLKCLPMKLIYLMLFLQISCAVFAESIIFVHFGKLIPSCLYTVVKQARYFNPNCKIYLLCNEESYPLLQNKNAIFFEEEKVQLVLSETVPKSTLHKLFEENHLFNTSFLGGFWLYTSKRFFALYDFMQDRDLSDVFHLENDTMLYADLTTLLPFFTHVSLAAPFQSQKGCIPCFVFCKDTKSLYPLLEHIVKLMNDFEGKKPDFTLNDMQTLASYHATYGSKALMPLPTLMAEYEKHYVKRKSFFALDNATPLRFLYKHGEEFPSCLFDAAGLAIFFNGNDRTISPDHKGGTIHARCLFNPSVFSFFWGNDEQGKVIPYLSFKGLDYRIINLHFHSKMPEEYASFGTKLKPLPSKNR